MTALKNVNYSSSKVRIVSPYELTRILQLKPYDTGQSLVDFLCMRFPYIPKENWEQRIRNGWLRMDDKPLSAETILDGRGRIYHYNPSVSEPSVPDSVKVIEETDDWLLVHKPAPLPMHQGGRYYKNTLFYILREMGYQDLKLIHRLDAVTSGLVLLARNKGTAKKLQSLFSKNKVEKWYYALVGGEMAEERLLIDAPIRRKKGFVFECGTDLESSKEAKTEIHRIRVFNGTSLVKCIPITGRTHQIRLHLKHAGLPIVDDPIYGPEGDMSGKRLQRSAISLQSSGLKIEELDFLKELPVPQEWI